MVKNAQQKKNCKQNSNKNFVFEVLTYLLSVKLIQVLQQNAKKREFCFEIQALFIKDLIAYNIILCNFNKTFYRSIIWIKNFMHLAFAYSNFTLGNKQNCCCKL